MKSGVLLRLFFQSINLDSSVPAQVRGREIKSTYTIGLKEECYRMSSRGLDFETQVIWFVIDDPT